MTPDKVREVLELIEEHFKIGETNEKEHCGDCTDEPQTCLKCLYKEYAETTTEALKIVEAIEQAKDELPEKKNTPLAGSVANGEIQTNDQQLYDDYIFNQALDLATPILAKKILENAELRKEIKRLEQGIKDRTSGWNDCYKELTALKDKITVERVKELLRYGMQVKISATGEYVMAEIEEKQLEVIAQAIVKDLKGEKVWKEDKQ